MSDTFTVMSKELRSYFTSPVAWVLTAAFLVLNSIFFVGQALGSQTATMDGMFRTLPVLMLLLGPILSMRLLAEEQRSGTLELLLTSPVSDAAVVIGKYLAVLGLYIVMLLFTLFYALLLQFYAGAQGGPLWGPILSGYFGALLLGGAFLAIGVFTSSLTDNPAVGAFIAVAITLALWLAGNFQSVFQGAFGDFLNQIAITDRYYNNLTVGVVALKDVIYYLSLMVIFLFMAIQSLGSRRWR
ncbi:MAG: hypothetical protein DLM69_00755 [Candidatus Chloroheliales bacterium]|nr:MAG: hypothetical protein DLM69_00755 [Chloroflexota bacterium]